MGRGRYGFLAVTVVLAGCISPPAADDAVFTERLDDANPPRPVIIAVVDTGVNPYHSHFRNFNSTNARLVINQLVADGVKITTVSVSTGNSAETYSQRLERDRATWNSLAPGNLYFIDGTRFLGVTLPSTYAPADPISQSLYPATSTGLLDEEGHGTQVVGTLVDAFPEALVLVVKIPSDYYANSAEAVPNFARALRWVADQPWIDIVSFSQGTPGNAPTVWDADLSAAVKSVDRSGKLFFAAVSNEPGHATGSATNGPPSVISVGAAIRNESGDNIGPSKGIDFVSEAVHFLPTAFSTDEYSMASGTSLAAPVVAGTAARILAEMRQNGTWATAGDAARPLRLSLNVTAPYFNTSDWEPFGAGYSDPSDDVIWAHTAPILPTPWVQMGWGYVGPEIVPAAVAYLKGESIPPPKPAEAIQYMETTYALREAYWEQRGV